MGRGCFFFHYAFCFVFHCGSESFLYPPTLRFSLYKSLCISIFSLSRILAGFSVNQRLKNPFLFLSLLLCPRFSLLIFLSFFLFFFPFGFNIWKLLFDFPFFKLLWKLLFFFLIILETSISCHTQMEGLSQNKVLMGYMGLL